MCLRMLISADDGDLQAFASAITAMSTVGIDSIDIFMCQSVDLASIVGVGHADSNVSARLLVGEIPNAVVEEDGDSWRVYLPVDNENDDDVVCASFDTSLLDSAFRCSPAMGIEHDRHGYDKVSTARTLLLSLRYYRDEKDNVVSFSRAVIEDSPSRSVVTEILASSTAITNDLHAEPSYSWRVPPPPQFTVRGSFLRRAIGASYDANSWFRNPSDRLVLDIDPLDRRCVVSPDGTSEVSHIIPVYDMIIDDWDGVEDIHFHLGLPLQEMYFVTDAMRFFDDELVWVVIMDDGVVLEYDNVRLSHALSGEDDEEDDDGLYGTGVITQFLFKPVPKDDEDGGDSDD